LRDFALSRGNPQKYKTGRIALPYGSQGRESKACNDGKGGFAFDVTFLPLAVKQYVVA